MYAFLSDSKDQNQRNVFNLVSQSRFLTEIENDIRKRYDVYTIESKELADKWNALYVELTDVISNVVNHSLMPQDSLCKHLTTIMREHEKKCRQQPNDFLASYNRLIPSLTQNVYYSRSEFIQIEKLAYKAAQIYKQWDLYRNGYDMVFKEISDSMEHARDILITTRNSLAKQ